MTGARWQNVKTQLFEMTPRSLWRSDILAICTILALLLTSHIAARRDIEDAMKDAEIINISGRQRMLSQRILLFAWDTYEEGDAKARETLKDNLALFAASHQKLTAQPNLSAASKLLYFSPGPLGTSLDAKVRAYIEDAEHVISADADAQAALNRMQAIGTDVLLSELNQAVSFFELAAVTRTKELRWIQNATLFAAVLMLMLERAIIFWPALRKVMHTLTKLREQKAALELSNVAAQEKNAELERLKDRMRHAALHDPLTGLANRRGLDAALKQRAQAGQTLTAMHIDLDRFKQINDTLGHPAGDFILCWVAQQLEAMIGEHAFAARIGGDEFVVLTDPSLTQKELIELAGTIIERLSEPVLYQASMCYFGASIGIAQLAGDAANVSDVLVNADVALYQAKQRGRGQHMVFSQEIKQEFDHTKALSDEIIAGLEAKQFLAFYQLQFDAQTLHVTGAEALVRWRHPSAGILPPSQFLPAAHMLSAIKHIDQLVMHAAAHDLAVFDTLSASIPRISLNVSAQRLEDRLFIEQIMQAELSPARFTFELTETVRLDEMTAAARQSLKEILDMGFDIEVDDFGTGHASILAVQNLRPKRIKIPRQLIATVKRDAAQRKLVMTIIDMAHSLGSQVVAEGIEDYATGDILRDMGCNMLQGYAYARPVAPGALFALLEARKKSGISAALGHQDVLRLAA
ncbi:MAG: EAL domain-containing protein [Pseudomonadota bacterium]